LSTRIPSRQAAGWPALLTQTDAGTAVYAGRYYVVQLCSPTRTSLLSGRYPYTIGMNGEVIVDGHPSCMPLSVSTIADRLSDAGWATSAYGKWDAGMTSWGCTPTCRGFGHFYGFYNAFNDYFTHHGGVGLDFRDDLVPVINETGACQCRTPCLKLT
jgi:arylsulfatase B